jgi:hypothetical protein
MVGNPVSVPDPAATPAKAALPFNNRRREILSLCGPVFFADIRHSLFRSVTEGFSLASYAARRMPSQQRINGKMRVPNCSLPITKSSKASITRAHWGILANSSSIRAIEA